MRNLFIASCAAIVLGAASLIAWTGQTPAPVKAAKKVETHFEVERLANGTTIYREVPNTGQLPDIAPAAGDPEPSTAPRFKYDPLTQTYRAQMPDGRQHMIRDPLNPSKD